MAIKCDPRTPKVVRTDHGYFSMLEFEEDIWVMQIRAKKQGEGTRLLRQLISYARGAGKNLHGLINPDETGMNAERMVRWYRRLGGEYNSANNVMTLRINK